MKMKRINGFKSPFRLFFLILSNLLLSWSAPPSFAGARSPQWPQDMIEQIIKLDSGQRFHYFLSNQHISDDVTYVLVVMHGHPRDGG